MATLMVKLRGASEISIEMGRDELVQIQQALLAGRENPETPVVIRDDLRRKEYLVFAAQVTAMVLET